MHELLHRKNYCTNYCERKQLLQRHPLRNPLLLRTPNTCLDFTGILSWILLWIFLVSCSPLFKWGGGHQEIHGENSHNEVSNDGGRFCPPLCGWGLPNIHDKSHALRMKIHHDECPCRSAVLFEKIQASVWDCVHRSRIDCLRLRLRFPSQDSSR